MRILGFIILFFLTITNLVRIFLFQFLLGDMLTSDRRLLNEDCLLGKTAARSSISVISKTEHTSSTVRLVSPVSWAFTRVSRALYIMKKLY